MRIRIRALTAIAAFSLSLGAIPVRAGFTEDFTDRTMRVDYFHTGGKGTEIIALDAVRSDGPWAGSTHVLVDETGYGKYQFRVHDADSSRLIYSRGFASVFGEWETTPEADAMYRTFHESLRFPWPKQPVRLSLDKRTDEGNWQVVWSTLIDPASRFVNPSAPAPAGKVVPWLESGDPKTKVDLLILGDGYSADEMAKFRADADRLLGSLFAEEPFKSRRSDFNIWLLETPQSSSGVNQPRTRDDRRTALGTSYNIFDSERYVLTLDNRALRDIAASAPYDYIEILVNEVQYGGGGIYNDQATVAVDSGFADYVFVHEFGHHFAALGDEYYTSSVAYETGAEVKKEPWEPNITAMHDPAKLKWRDLVDEGTPLPTPWRKEEYEAYSRAIQKRRAEIRQQNLPESVMDALFTEERQFLSEFLANERYAGRVGAFEGAGYEEHGLYRPEVDCIMFTRNKVGFCDVCTRAINLIIDMYASPAL